MKHTIILTIVLFCVLLFGCRRNVQKSLDEKTVNTQLIKTYNDIALENAIISEHTLYPYHFVKDGRELNELGIRDLGILIRHFMKQTGDLNVRRQNMSASLYDSRVQYVIQKLQDAGIRLDRIKISDNMPGGTGIASERVILISSDKQKLSSAGN